MLLLWSRTRSMR